MPLLNTEDDLQKAKQALMNSLRQACQTDEETTIFTRADVWVDLNPEPKGGLFVGPTDNDGRRTRYYFTGGFGGDNSWHFAQEDNQYVLYHTTHGNRVSSDTLKEKLQGRFRQEELDNLNLFRICSTGDYDTFETIKDFALLCDEAREERDRVTPPPPAGGGGNPGPSGGGERSAATWSARQSQYVNKIVPALDELGWNQRVNGWPWQPDLLRGSLTSDKRILIEVKPDSGAHNIITAIGQVICYSSSMKNVIKVIAVPGSKSLPSHITEAVKSYNIKILDLDQRDLLTLLKVIVESHLAT